MSALSDDAESRARGRVGSVLNEKWSLERLLGLGGMAAVYAGRHRNGARAAVKVLHMELSSDQGVRERFRREGYAANRVEHPGAVKVLDDDVIASGPDAGIAYLVMELLEGESLHDRLERGPPVSEHEFLAIAERVLEVLEAAHSRGVIHRDLKPENLFLVGVSALPDGREDRHSIRAPVKVLDFGLARLLDGQAITSHGLALGTPSFMSPEQAGGRIDQIDGRTDLFALAATGFRVRAGRRIHDGANAVELVTKMATLAAPPIRAVVSEVSEPFARIIDRGLEFRREDRYESATAMREDVVRALGELEAAVAITLFAGAPPPATPENESTIELSAGDLDRSAGPRDASNLARHRRWIAWSAACLSFGLLATVSTELWRDRRRSPSANFDAGASLPSAGHDDAPSALQSAEPDDGRPLPSASRDIAPVEADDEPEVPGADLSSAASDASSRGTPRPAIAPRVLAQPSAPRPAATPRREAPPNGGAGKLPRRRPSRPPSRLPHPLARPRR